MYRRTRITLGAAIALAATAGLASPAGAVRRPDYADLGNCAPDVTIFADGETTFSIPAVDVDNGLTCVPQHWHIATFHVPHSGDQWHEDQFLGDIPFDVILGPGEYTFRRLRFGVMGSTTAPDAPCRQQDMWLEGQEEVYAAWTLDNGICDDAAATTTTTAAPAPPATDVPTTVVPPATDGGTVTDGPRGNDVPPSDLGPVGDDQSVGVEASSVRAAELPMTGAHRTGLLAGIAAALLSGGTSLVGLSRRVGRREMGR